MAQEVAAGGLDIQDKTILTEFKVSLGYRGARLKNKMNEGYLGES